MSDKILLDQILISVRVPKNLLPEESGDIVRTLRSRRFQAAFERAAKKFFGRYKSMRLASLMISR